MAQQVAQAISVFQEQRTGHAPKSMTVVLSEDALVVMLHGVLSPAERALALSPERAAQVREFHRQLFQSSMDDLRRDIERITGVTDPGGRSRGGDGKRCGGAFLHIWHHGAGFPVRNIINSGSLEE